MAFLLGVDTGGTYTDAVIFDEDTDAIVAKSKAPTTHEDLAAGIGAAIDGALSRCAVDATEIALVSLSTTLATNALVEDKGRRACLILIGFDDDALERAGLRAALVDNELILAQGGHGSHGDETAPLDLATLESAIDRVAPRVDAFAVTAQFSVRNPGHEVAVRDLIRTRTDLPVTCSHELSASLNGPKRGVTTLLNAQLIALIDDLVAAAGTTLAQRSIAAPLMVVRGDGSLVSAAFVRERPIETILSGPAASLIGASHLTNEPDAIICDIGGTTTDIAVLRDGWPELSPDGASVAGHQTMVEAVEMHTHAIGGDSELRVAERALGAQLELGPRRVVPLARVGLEHPEAVAAMLRRQLATAVPGEFDGILVWATGIPSRAGELSTAESKLLAMLGSSPCPAEDLVKSRIDDRALSRLIRQGLARQASFTPTDAAHVLGHQSDLDRASAELAAELFARRRDRLGTPIADSAFGISEAAIGTVVRRSAEALLAAALARDGLLTEAATGPLVAAGFDKTARSTRVDIGVAVPVVGLGAPARTYYPLVAELVGSRCTVPQHADVANAIGAVVGRVQITRNVLVSAPRRGVFRVHTDDPTTLYDLDEAKDLAATAASGAAMADAERAGARDIETEGRWTERSATIEDKPYFVEGTYSATASGRPKLR